MSGLRRAHDAWTPAQDAAIRRERTLTAAELAVIVGELGPARTAAGVSMRRCTLRALVTRKGTPHTGGHRERAARRIDAHELRALTGGSPLGVDFVRRDDAFVHALLLAQLAALQGRPA
jgi:hypothetical protein